jgi:hypothetical protein
MSNVTATRELILDTVGWIMPGPVLVRKIVLIPNSAGDTCLFKKYIAHAKDQEDAATTTIASTSQIQATGKFTTGKVAANDVIKIYNSSTGYNLVTQVVASRDSNDQVTMMAPALTNDAGATYSWFVYPTYNAIEILSQATSKKQEELDFGYQGRQFTNLCLVTLSSSAKVYVYLA